MAIAVPQTVFDGLEYVRESGETNMVDVGTVQRLVYENEFHATVSWMEDHRDQYLEGVRTGIEVIE